MADAKIIAAIEALADEVEAVHELATASASDIRTIAAGLEDIRKSQSLILQGLTKSMLDAEADRKRFFDYVSAAPRTRPKVVR